MSVCECDRAVCMCVCARACVGWGVKLELTSGAWQSENSDIRPWQRFQT